jgi:hypothetical protein
MRISYELHGLLEGEAAADPLQQFKAWFKAAVESKVTAGAAAAAVGVLAGWLLAYCAKSVEQHVLTEDVQNLPACMHACMFCAYGKV